MWTCPPARITVGVDFGDASTRALQAAARLATATGASLRAVHAEPFEAPPYFTADQIERMGREQADTHRRATAYLEHAARSATGLEVAALVVFGPPTAVLLRAAVDADLLVLGTHGRRGPAHWWLGSVAERVAQLAEVPVLVVHDGPVDRLFSRPVLVDQDLTPGMQACVEALARFDHGTVTLVGPGEATAEARLYDASILVVPRPRHDIAPFALDAAGSALVRACRRPLLFIPQERSS
jgi:nucleotide-binding universal stress UspA family protein